MAAPGESGLAHRSFNLDFLDRRDGGDRRKQSMGVSFDRRTGLDRRSHPKSPPNVRFMCSFAERALSGIVFENFPQAQLLVISDSNHIIRCEWNLWTAILRVDPRKLSLLKDVYERPSERDRILKEIEVIGKARRKISLRGADGLSIIFDAVFTKNNTDNLYYTLLHIIDVNLNPIHESLSDLQ